LLAKGLKFSKVSLSRPKPTIYFLTWGTARS